MSQSKSGTSSGIRTWIPGLLQDTLHKFPKLSNPDQQELKGQLSPSSVIFKPDRLPRRNRALKGDIVVVHLLRDTGRRPAR